MAMARGRTRSPGCTPRRPQTSSGFSGDVPLQPVRRRAKPQAARSASLRLAQHDVDLFLFAIAEHRQLERVARLLLLQHLEKIAHHVEFDAVRLDDDVALLPIDE